MPDPHYPSVDINFVIEHITASGRLEDDGIIKEGAYIIPVIDEIIS